jgi:hypothetical protein
MLRLVMKSEEVRARTLYLMVKTGLVATRLLHLMMKTEEVTGQMLHPVLDIYLKCLRTGPAIPDRREAGAYRRWAPIRPGLIKMSDELARDHIFNC